MPLTKISSKKPCYTYGHGPLINLLQGCHTTHSLLFRGFLGFAGGGGVQQQSATQTLRIHFLGFEGFAIQSHIEGDLTWALSRDGREDPCNRESAPRRPSRAELSVHLTVLDEILVRFLSRKAPRSKFWRILGEKCGEKLVKCFANLRPSISRKGERKKFHEKSSTNSTNHDTKFVHCEALGACGGTKIWQISPWA